MEEERKQHFYSVNNDIGQAIAELRQFYGLTVAEAAERGGMTEKRLAAIERGRLPQNLNALCNYVEALGGKLAITPTDNPGVTHCEFIPTQSKN